MEDIIMKYVNNIKIILHYIFFVLILFSELHCYSNSRKSKHSLITENSFKNFGNIEKL